MYQVEEDHQFIKWKMRGGVSIVAKEKENQAEEKK